MQLSCGPWVIGSGRVVKKSQGGWWIFTFRDRSFVLMTAHMMEHVKALLRKYTCMLAQ